MWYCDFLSLQTGHTPMAQCWEWSAYAGPVTIHKLQMVKNIWGRRSFLWTRTSSYLGLKQGIEVPISIRQRKLLYQSMFPYPFLWNQWSFFKLIRHLLITISLIWYFDHAPNHFNCYQRNWGLNTENPNFWIRRKKQHTEGISHDNQLSLLGWFISFCWSSLYRMLASIYQIKVVDTICPLLELLGRSPSNEAIVALIEPLFSLWMIHGFHQITVGRTCQGPYLVFQCHHKFTTLLVHCNSLIITQDK